MEPSERPSAPAGPRRWAGVGRSLDACAETAGAAATRDALAAGDDPRLLLVFASDAHDHDALLGAIGDAAGEVPVAGATTAGEIDASGPGDGSVVVLALGGPGFSVSTAAVPDALGDPREAGADVAACLGDVADREHRALLLLADGCIVGVPDVVRGAYSVAGAGVPLVGGVIGDAACPRRPAQFHGRDVLRGGVVGIAIGSDAPLGLGVRHGHEPVGEPMLVTGAAAARLDTLDERPAAEVLLERIARDGGRTGDRLALGLRRRTGGSDVRVATLDGAADRSVLCEMAPGSLVWLMHIDADRALDGTDAACADALAGLDGADPLALLVFNCTARRDELGPGRTVDEVQRLARHAAGAPIAGLYTHGEIARTRGMSGFHNQTLVVLAVA